MNLSHSSSSLSGFCQLPLGRATGACLIVSPDLSTILSLSSGANGMSGKVSSVVVHLTLRMFSITSVGRTKASSSAASPMRRAWMEILVAR